MDLSKVKMVVTDMDGTLLNSNHEVSERFFQLFTQLKKEGILFVAASGRQYHSIIDKLSTIKNDIIVVAENGAYVMQNNEELLSTILGRRMQHEVLDIIKDLKNVYPVLCGKNKAYLTGESSKFVDLLKQYYTNYQLVSDLYAVEEEILKIALFNFESSERNIYPTVRPLESYMKVKVSGPNWVDISSPNAHKGFAIKALQERFNISESETMVFGDYNNDLEMLALADYSFAMKNAHENVLQLANYSTDSNDEFGVERILEKLLNQK